MKPFFAFLAFIAFAGCAKFDGPTGPDGPTPPADRRVYISAQTQAEVTVWPMSSQGATAAGLTPFVFEPPDTGIYLVRLKADGYEVWHGDFLVRRDFPANDIRVNLTPIAVPPAEEELSLAGTPDTIRAGETVKFTVASSHVNYVFCSEQGPAPLNGEFTVTLFVTQTVACYGFGATSTPAVATKTVVVLRPTEPPPPPPGCVIIIEHLHVNNNKDDVEIEITCNGAEAGELEETDDFFYNLNAPVKIRTEANSGTRFTFRAYGPGGTRIFTATTP